MHGALQPYRGQDDRRLMSLPEQPHARVDVAHVHESSNTQLQPVEGLAIGAHCFFIVGSTGDEVIDWLGQLPACHGLELENIDGVPSGARKLFLERICDTGGEVANERRVGQESQEFSTRVDVHQSPFDQPARLSTSQSAGRFSTIHRIDMSGNEGSIVRS